MSYYVEDTIAAIATAAGGAARAVIRIAGPDTVACLSGCFQPQHAPAGGALHEIKAAEIVPGHLRLADLDRELALACDVYLWPDRRSYTRMPQAEIHMPGWPPLAAAVLRTLCAHGARLAEPGEFTLRAFLGGRLDLTQAEAVLGVIDATADEALDVALRQLAGGLSTPLSQLRDRLLDLLAHLEAGLDFVEEDIEFIQPEQLIAQLDAARQQVAELASQMQHRTETSDAVRIVLVGSPNVGKSSLFNALIARTGELPGAIVSELPGTTRDYLIADLDLDGVACQLVDTAGVEPGDVDDKLWAAAQDASAAQHRHAQVQLVCIDTSRPPDDWEAAQLAAAEPGARLIVLTKSDLARHAFFEHWHGGAKQPSVAVSSPSAEGLPRLRAAVRELILDTDTAGYECVSATAARCGDSLRRSAELLDSACQAAAAQVGEEIVAAEVRGALDELAQVVGAVYTDDILDRIFSRFCIGK